MDKSSGDPTRHLLRRAIADTADVAPDLVFDVDHDQDCGDNGCTRSQGKVSVAVTWLDPAIHGAAFRADIDDQGLLVCTQIVQRATDRLTRLANER